MKKILSLFLAAAICLGAAAGANAIDFKAKGQWLFNFNAGEYRLLKSARQGNHRQTFADDKFTAIQRIRLQLEAIASENLSGQVFFQIGMQQWGKASQGGALGADGTQVKVRTGYIDWMWPGLDLKTRMGIQYFRLPSKAGGPAVVATRIGGIVSSYEFNDNMSITGFWMRPFNDNFNGYSKNGEVNVDQGYLDNMDLFGLILPLRFDGFEITPWAMYGMRGKNTQWSINNTTGRATLERYATAGWPNYTLYPYMGILGRAGNDYTNNSTGKAYGALFWAGLPMQLTAFDPLNIEVDLNYGYVESMGRFNVYKGAATPQNRSRASTERQGWLAKALVEYKLDWGIPGIFGWYSSGDDGNPKNGSERMPSIAAYGDFTSFVGDTFLDLGYWYDMDMDYSGTWGIGLQLKDMTFFTDKVKNTLRFAWWGGTNSPGMVKYMDNAYAWTEGIWHFTGPYLTTNDGLLEANWITNYQMYENFLVQFDMGYVANFIDNDTWKKAGARDSSFSRQDAWKLGLKFYYSF